MNLGYFEYCKGLLSELEEAIESGNNLKIYQLIPDLIPVVAITYYCLTEDMIITRDDKNTDINTKFKLNIPTGPIDKLFEYKELMNITKKMTDSRLWLLSGIRNSIMHGSSSVDLDNDRLIIDNKSFKNQLECEIDLSWFVDYLRTINVKNNYISDNFSIIFAKSINQIDKSRNLKDLSSDYIYSYLVHFFKVNIKSKDDNPEPIPRDDIMRYIFEYTHEYLETINSSLEMKDDEFSFINILKRGYIKKENETEDESNAIIFKHFFVKHLKYALGEKFPNYNFEVKAVKPKDEFKDLLDEDKISQIYKEENLERQSSFASTWITNEILNDLMKPFEEEIFLREFISTFDGIAYFKQPEYIPDSDMEALLSSNDEDVENAEVRILNRIKGYNAILKKTYDKVILRKILMQDFVGPDLLVAMKLWRDLRDEFGYVGYDNEEALISVKKKCPFIFEKYSAILKQQNGMSDQDLVAFNNQPLHEIRDFNHILNRNKKELVKMMVYLAGINCYVLNKEVVFDEDNGIYESVIDDTFEAYSKTKFDHDYSNERKKLDKINAKLEKQSAKHFSDKTPQHVIDRHNQETQSLLDLKSKSEKQLSEFETKEIDGTNMVKVDKKDISTLIRNSLSHPNRIEVLDDFTVKLTDFDNNGEISGVVFVPLSNLLKFFSNDIFHKKLSKNLER